MRETAATSRYRGPSALGEGARRFASLTFMLAATDFKLRWFGSALGYLWTLMKPLLLFGVLYVVFTEVVKFGEGVKNYPVYLLCAIVLFTYFGETTSRGVTSLVDRDNLLRKIRFPRLVIPLAVALHSLFNLGLNMIAVFVFVVAAGIEPNVDWLQLPLLVGMMVVLATGVTMMLSALYVRFRDVEPIWEVVLQLLFYASPVIYVVTTIPNHDLQRLAVMNPIGAILTQMRHALVDPSAPTAITVLGGWQWLAVPIGIVVALFALGWWVFMREAPRIAENL
jgi:ABC-2 type transport system permease protein